MESFTLNTLANYAKERGFKYLKGEYIPTPKNEMVKNHYLNLGFEPAGDHWLLDVNDYENQKCFINRK